MSTSPSPVITAPRTAPAPAASQDNSVTVSFEKEKETKNTIKFEEVERPGQPKVIGTLYVQKYAVGSNTKLQVTVKFQQ